MFVKYLNIDRDSPVTMYEIGADYISVVFKNCKKIYTYTYSTAGNRNVENMKSLARRGNGLNSYIQLNCKTLYKK